MWPPVALRCVCFLLAARFADADITLHKKMGDDVVLQPGTDPSVAITSIIWRVEANIAMQFDGTEVDSYFHFRERGRLNITSGEMTIAGLTRHDSAKYSPEINNVLGRPIRLVVVPPVPTPTVNTSCNDEGTSCVLTCEGDVTDVGPVTYGWRSGDKVLASSSREQHITKEQNGSGEFSCELQNLVSRQSSLPVPNPFIKRSLRLTTGLIVFMCLLTAVMLLVFVHRWKAGMWFFQKESMPWEADFWRKNERQPADVQPQFNGTTAPLKKETDEETPMT